MTHTGIQFQLENYKGMVASLEGLLKISEEENAEFRSALVFLRDWLKGCPEVMPGDFERVAKAYRFNPETLVEKEKPTLVCSDCGQAPEKHTIHMKDRDGKSTFHCVGCYGKRYLTI